MLKSLPGQLPLVDGGATFSLARSIPFRVLPCAFLLSHITFIYFFTSNWFFSFLFFWTLLHHPHVEKSALSSFSGFLSVPLSSAVSLLCFFPSLSLCQCPCGLFLIFLFHLSFIHPFFYLSHCPHLSLIASIRPPSFSLHPPPPPFPKQSVTVMLLKRTQCVILNQTDELGVE